MPRILQLAVVGTAAGLFSGLFGVGGGIVFVPALAAGGSYAGLALPVAAQMTHRALTAPAEPTTGGG